MPARRYQIEQPGELTATAQAYHGSLQRALDDVRADVDAAEDMPYTPGTPSNWASPAPTTLKAAIDRLAAAVDALGPAP